MNDSPAASAPATRGFSASIVRALRHRNFRLFFGGQGLSLFGTWMTTVATRWLVYEKMPGQDWILGFVTFAGQIPILLAPLAGAYVEGSSRHRALILTQSLSMIQSFSLAFLALTGIVEVWQVLVLAAFQGFVNALDVPARQAFLIEMVDDRSDLSNAIALNSSMFNGARLLGPAVAGLILAQFTGRVGLGAGICFMVDGISYLAVIVALLRMNVKAQAPRTSERQIWRDLREGFHYSFRSRPIRAILFLLGLVSIFGAPFTVLMPAFAKNILLGNASTYGLLLAISGGGALLGALYLASRSTVLGLGRVIAVCCALFSLSIIGFAFSSVLWLSMLVTFTASFGMMVQMAASNTILQTVVEDEMRARVMSFYALTVLGMIPIGSLLCSGLVIVIGAPYTVALGGAVSLAGAVYFTLKLRELRAAARPMLERAGVLPPLAAGIQAATTQTGDAA
ncbi:MAG TPA: MFS transporter [Pirellulales bacterium]|jgi:MFS family permease|nr:MFS transporter [Pirellulales bacterium]